VKYRHSFHAGNFADVHKHVALLALLGALKKKDKGFLYLDTHAGRGVYDLSGSAPEAQGGLGRFLETAADASELRSYAEVIAEFRAGRGGRLLYPGSPIIAAGELRPQDRAVFVESQAAEAQALQAALGDAVDSRGRAAAGATRTRVERGDGFERLRAWLPPPERRGLTFLDPPYEQSREDFARVAAAIAEGLKRFATGVTAAWYPIKEERVTAAWQAELARTVAAPVLVSELWVHPRDSRVALNGSGLLIVNPPYLTAERMQVWLPELLEHLAAGPAAGSSVRMLSQSPS
jgi:23S rRNA (adenine2030-N6)-methyltransferase